MAEKRTIGNEVNEFMTLQRVQEFFDAPIAGVGITGDVEGTTGADTIRVSLQVKDRLRKDWPGRWVILVWFSATDGGDPDATGNFVAAVPGTFEMQIVIPDAMYMLEASTAGLAQIDLAVAGVTSRYVNAFVLGKAESKAITFA